MKKFAIVASVALLAACGSKTEAPAVTATTDAAADAAAVASAAPYVATPGSYDVTAADGTKSVDTLMADGKYVSRDAKDKVTDKGTWANKDGKTCFTSTGKAEVCYTISAVAPDGSFTATDPTGVVVKVAPHAK